MAITTHGGTYTALYKAWIQMRHRCNNPADRGWHRYGGRGISVCERWQSFENFRADMGERPVGMSLDRLDNDGNYEPSNCRWATPRQQIQNSSRFQPLTHAGKTMSRREWEISLGLAKGVVTNRLRAGWSLERALTQPKIVGSLKGHCSKPGPNANSTSGVRGVSWYKGRWNAKRNGKHVGCFDSIELARAAWHRYGESSQAKT